MYVLKYTYTYYIFDLKPIVVSLIISNDNQFIRITLGLNVNACKMNNNNAIYVIICQKNVNSGMVEGFLSSCVYILYCICTGTPLEKCHAYFSDT